jgi:hypothetical protein
MITKLSNLPSNMVGFSASGEVTENDIKTVVLPAVQELVSRTGELNYLLQLDTSLKDFTLGAWVQDAVLGAKHLLKWNRAAIISDVNAIKKFTEVFSVVVPGEFRGFAKDDLQSAIDWVSGGYRQNAAASRH